VLTSPAAVIIPAANAARSPKILKRMMRLPIPPLLVTAQTTLFVVSFHYQSVAIPALLGLKKLCGGLLLIPSLFSIWRKLSEGLDPARQNRGGPLI
jgi:hypothetical protein